MPLIAPDRWPQLALLLDEVLDLPPAERATWLEALRSRAPDDAAALDVLLADDRTSWLGTTHRARALTGVVPDLTAAAQGSVLGPWRLDRPLGRGGMGTVWLATRIDGRFTGEAAVKLLHPAMIAGEGGALFRREANVLARLTHPAIARLYDAGVTDDGQPYLVLEYVEGQPFDAWCEANRPSLTQRLELIDRVCDAVAHAHARGIVHRDLKPGNLFVTSSGAVKLLDFGIAFLMGETGDERVHPYTPRYAAPEQRTGGAVTTATDVFALGRVLGELLGVAGDHDGNASVAAKTIANPAALGPIPADLVAIVHRAQQADPAARYPTVAALADDLRRFRRHEPVDAHAGGTWYRAQRFARRHAAGLTAAVVAISLLIGGTVLSVRQAREARAQRNIALIAERRAQAFSEVMMSLMSELPATDPDVRAVTALRRARRLLDAYLGNDQEERARLAIDLARQFSLFSRREEARGLLADASRDAQALGNPSLETEATCQLQLTGDTRTSTTTAANLDSLQALLPPTQWRARAVCTMAQAQQLLMGVKGDSADAQANAAVAMAQRAGDTVSLFYATLLLDQLQTIGWSKGDFHTKISQYQRAARALDSLGLGLSIPALRVASEAATYSYDFGRLLVADSATAAVREHLEAGERWRAVTPRLALDLAQLAQGLARPDEARRWFERALLQTRASANEPISVRTRQTYARFLGESGDVRLATAQLDTLRGMLAQRSNSAFDAARLRTQAVILAASGQRARGAAMVDSMLRSRGYPDSLRLIEAADAMTEHAHLQFALGRPAEARIAMARVRSRFARDTVANNGTRRLATLLLLEARIQAGAGHRDSAYTTANAALRALRTAIGDAHPLTRAASALGDSLAAAGAKAIPMKVAAPER